MRHIYKYDELASIFNDAELCARWIMHMYYGLPDNQDPYSKDEILQLRKALFSTLKQTGWTHIHSLCIPLMTSAIKERLPDNT